MPNANDPKILRGLWPTMLGTLASRVLGLARDIATAALLGLGRGHIMDALVVAFRIPNLLRRLLGEGALATSYLPVLSEQLVKDRAAAWQLTSALLTLLAVLLTLVTLLGELACGVIALVWGHVPGVVELTGLTAAMLPYLICVCIAAQLSATLHALGSFTLPAAMSAVLNVCWLVGALAIAPLFAPNQLAEALALTGCILLGGILQVALQGFALWKLGFRFDFDVRASWQPLRRIVQSMAPMALGLAVVQINTLFDSLLAWSLSAPAAAQRTIAWLPGNLSYPMQSGAAAAIYYGERFYQLPVGLIGMAIATVAFPLLSRHAARRDHESFRADLSGSLRVVLFITIPASVGLMLIATPAVRLLFERGAFSADDTLRAAGMVVCYSSAVWAYCALPVLVRGFYARGDQTAPAKAALAAVGLDLTLNLALVWPMGEAGLAVSTALSAVVQLGLLAWVFSRRHLPLVWGELSVTAVRSVLATSAMAAVVWPALNAMPHGGRLFEAAWLVTVCVSGLIVYLGAAKLSGSPELDWLFGRSGGRGSLRPAHEPFG